jgi:16S rRNA (uracil1498-N3)-methyltransferase
MIFSNTEFYYTEPAQISESHIYLDKTESKHLIQVMRHSIGDSIFVTDGAGNVYTSEIESHNKNSATLAITNRVSITKRFENITFYLPILKTSDRLELALEKCIELGFTDFAIYSADKSYNRNIKIERLNKIALAAMKQSLSAFLPKIKVIKKLTLEILNGNENIIFDQSAKINFQEYLTNISNNGKLNLIIGPEGGFSKSEMEFMSEFTKIQLTKNRLRTETAAITVASIISTFTK